MSYAEALERLKKIQDGPGEAVPKVTEAPYGTYGTPALGPSENFNRASGTSGRCQSEGGNEVRAADEASGHATPGGAKSDGTMPGHWRLLEITREATKGTLCDSRDLADFLIRCKDPGWCTPEAARWWARYHDKHGGFPE